MDEEEQAFEGPERDELGERIAELFNRTWEMEIKKPSSAGSCSASSASR